MEPLILQKLDELIALAEADGNKALQGILNVVAGAVKGKQELHLFKGIQPIVKELVDSIHILKAQQN